MAHRGGGELGLARLRRQPARAPRQRAARQHQLDGYGWTLDAAWLLTNAGHRLYSETWRAMRGFAGEVARRWSEPDAGIWEIRGDGAHHVHSKLMRWLALDPALRIAERQRTPQRQRRAWQKARDALAAEVTVKGFDASRFTYTCTYGSQDVDAALLILPYRGGHCPWGQLEQLQPSVRSCRCFRCLPCQRAIA